MNINAYQKLMRRLKSGNRVADQKTRQDLCDAVEMLEQLYNATIDFGDDSCEEQQRRDEKHGVYPQHVNDCN